MIDISIQVPDDVHDRLVAALQQRYPGLVGVPHEDVVRAALIQLVLEAIEIGERGQFEQALQEEMKERREVRRAQIGALRNQIVPPTPIPAPNPGMGTLDL